MLAVFGYLSVFFALFIQIGHCRHIERSTDTGHLIFAQTVYILNLKNSNQHSIIITNFRFAGMVSGEPNGI